MKPPALLLRSLLALVFLALTAPGTHGEVPKKIKFMLDWYPQAECAGYYYALIHNYYKDAGLDVEIIPASPGNVGVTLALTGAVDLAMAPTDQIMIARSQGLPVKSVMATMQHDPKGILVHEESPIKSFSDLDGHTLAVQPGTAWFSYITKKYNLTKIREARLTFGVGNFVHDPNYLQECFITSEPFFAGQLGAKTRTLLVHDTGYDSYRGVYATDKLISARKDDVQAFVTAAKKGWKQYLKDPVQTDEEIKRRNPQMTQAQLDFSRKQLIDYHFIDGFSNKGEAIGKLDPARFEAQFNILRDLKILAPDFDYTQSFTTEFSNAEIK